MEKKCFDRVVGRKIVVCKLLQGSMYTSSIDKEVVTIGSWTRIEMTKRVDRQERKRKVSGRNRLYLAGNVG